MTDMADSLCSCRICLPRGDESNWDQGDEKLVADVNRHGWHVLRVLGDSSRPGWSYTVGLWHSFRSPEVAMFGLRLEDMAIWLNQIGEQARAGSPPRPDERRAGVLAGFDLTFRRVHPSWYPELFGYALWFTGPPLPFLQAVWPDQTGLYPWDEDVGDRCLRDQPRGWEPYDQQPSGPWHPVNR